MRLNQQLTTETGRLRRSWDQHPSDMLRSYMVADIHDPLINPQSIHSRHFLIHALFGRKFQKVCEEEFRFAAIIQWLRKQAISLKESEDWQAVEHALVQHCDNADGTPLPYYVSNVFRVLPFTEDGRTVPNYVSDLIRAARQCERPDLVFEQAKDYFATLWSQWLAQEQPDKISVIEPACGSANDYRALNQFGLARHLDYLGFDLCEKNVANARELFPGARFESGNVFSIAAEGQSFDCCYVHDLLEHFSLEGMEQAVAEICRVTRRGIFVGFFQLHEGSEHVVRPVNDYHWNTLSLSRVRKLFEEHGFKTQAICVDHWLKYWLGSTDSLYYDTAYDLVAWRESGAGEDTITQNNQSLANARTLPV